MSLVMMGASHKTCPVQHRERIAFASEEAVAGMRALVASPDISEAVILSTCNRVEVYVNAKTDRIGLDALTELFAARTGGGAEAGTVQEGAAEGGASGCIAAQTADAASLAETAFDDDNQGSFDPRHFYTQRGMDTARHLMRVVCSLDSQVLGEAQILGQAKRAMELSAAAGCCNDALLHLFKQAIHLGKRVHAETRVGADSVSLSTTAFKRARQERPDLHRCRVLLVGAGNMAALAHVYLAEAGVRDCAVTSRTLQHAQDFASERGIEAASFEQLHDELATADVAFVATAAEEPIVHAEALERARRRHGTQDKPLLLVDESVPRNVEPACRNVPGVNVVDIDDLQRTADDNLAQRLAAVVDAERLVAEAEEDFLRWMQEQQVVPTIRDMYAKGNAIAEHELERAARAFAAHGAREVDDEERKILQAYGQAIVKKLLHGPTVRLRKEAATPDSYYYTSGARYLFGLDTYPAGTHHRPCGRPCHAGKACPHGKTGAVMEQCTSKGDAHGQNR